ncbi:MAG: Asp-tRNA(Asn)/Glu-tRNA(Gln) amidotransferase subunit GatA [Promethearchaeota archaeon]
MGELKAYECVSSVFNRIREVEDKVHSFVTLNEKASLQRAKEIDLKIGRGEDLGRLPGVCVSIKDNMCMKDIPTTCSSRMLQNFIPPYNATVVGRLLQEDAIIIGKTNMDEFAMGTTTETSYFGPTKNPWDLSRVPGGSSGGSAASIASEEAIISLGSDTGGSIRCPASFCSVIGLKPTYGLVSRYGLIAYANSLEQIGPITGDVYDSALTLTVISGNDPRDSTSTFHPPIDYTKFLVEDVNGMKIGVIKEFMGEGTDQNVAENIWNGIYRLGQLGASYQEVSIPSLKYSLAAYYLIAMSEASSNLARFDGLRYGYNVKEDLDWNQSFSKNRSEGFGPEVRRRIMLGTYALSAGYFEKYYLKALQVRTLLRSDFESVFKDFDVLIGPTMPVLPFKFGEKISDPLSLYLCDVNTVSINLTGFPGISLPCGFSEGLPTGMQLISPPFREDLLFKTAYTFEKHYLNNQNKPQL